MDKYENVTTKFNVTKALELVRAPYSAEGTKELKGMCALFNVAEGCIDLFAHITPIRGSVEGKDGKNLYSVMATVSNLKEQGKVVTTNNKYIDSSYMINLIKFVGLANPGDVLGKMSTTKAPHLGAFTPKFLYAFKRNKGIQYEEWDKEDEGMYLALGKRLKGILTFACLTEDVYTRCIAPSVAELRTAGLKGKPATNYMLAVAAADLACILLADETEVSIEANRSPTARKDLCFCLQIMLQTWTANLALRVPDTMILDMWDWDNTPEAVDAELDLGGDYRFGKRVPTEDAF